VRHAARGSEEQRLDWAGLLSTMAPYFEAASGGHMIDQAWQPRLAEGMVRAYLVEGRVAGFGHQAINALYPTPAGQPAVQPGPRLYHGADGAESAAFQPLRQRLEAGWVDLLCERVGLPRERLPMLWDADFLLGDGSGDEPRFVLCEINVSSVSPFPPTVVAPLVRAVLDRLGAASSAISRGGGRARGRR
jgi:hypothetical protein